MPVEIRDRTVEQDDGGRVPGNKDNLTVLPADVKANRAAAARRTGGSALRY